MKTEFDLGELIANLRQTIVLEDLVETLERLEDPADDPNETIANKSFTIAAFYEVVRYYSIPSEYKKYAEDRKWGDYA